MLIITSCVSVDPITLTQTIYDEPNRACYQRQYKYRAEFIGPISKAVEVDIMKCSRVVGWDTKNHPKEVEWKEEVRLKFVKAKK
jgi:hypothetical protein